MKTVSIQLFNFEELNDTAKEQARAWFRRASESDTFWHECVTDEAEEFGALLGIDIDKIPFRGFCSQGDGACFVGTWRASQCTESNVDTLIANAPLDETLHAIAHEFGRLAKLYPFATFTTFHRGNYCHEHSVNFEFCACEDEIPSGFSNEQYGLMVGEIEAVSRRFMRWIYAQLESAYNYETSDENVDSNIVANEYTFLASGARFDA